MSRVGEVWEWVSEMLGEVDTHIVLWEMSKDEVAMHGATARDSRWWMTLIVETSKLHPVSEFAFEDESLYEENPIYKMLGRWERVV